VSAWWLGLTLSIYLYIHTYIYTYTHTGVNHEALTMGQLLRVNPLTLNPYSISGPPLFLFQELAHRERLVARLPAEPDTGGARVLIRMPDGSRKQRRFPADASLQALVRNLLNLSLSIHIYIIYIYICSAASRQMPAYRHWCAPFNISLHVYICIYYM